MDWRIRMNMYNTTERMFGTVHREGRTMDDRSCDNNNNNNNNNNNKATSTHGWTIGRQSNHDSLVLK